MLLMDEERLITIEVIPYKSFKEKIRLVNDYIRKVDKVVVEKGYVYTEKTT